MRAEGKLNLDAIITNSLPPDITKHFPNAEGEGRAQSAGLSWTLKVER
jgi:hypothetical protein